MMYRHTPIQDEIHLLLIIAFLTAFFGGFIALFGADMSNQKFVSMFLAVLGIIFSHIANYKYQQNLQQYPHKYKTGVVKIACLGNFVFVVYCLFFSRI